MSKLWLSSSILIYAIGLVKSSDANHFRLFFDEQNFRTNIRHIKVDSIGDTKEIRTDDLTEKRASHRGFEAFHSEGSTPKSIVVQLPNRKEELVLNHSSFHTIGSRITGESSSYKVWHGVPKHNGKTIGVNQTASFVLTPSGELTCNIMLEHQHFQCKPCSVHQTKKNDDPMCIDMVEIEKRKNFPPEISKPVPKHVYQGKQRNLGKERQLKMFESNLQHDFHSPKVEGVDGRILQDSEDDGTEIDVLIMYTSATVAKMGSEDIVKAAIAESIAKTNLSFEYSKINLQANVVGWGVSDYTETGNVIESLEYVTFDSTVSRLRDVFGADLVTFVTIDGDLQIRSGMTSMSCGIGWTPNPAMPETDAYAYSAVDFECMLFNLSIPHEWGHNFGCDHNYENSEQDRVVPYAYGYQSTMCHWHTIMSYPCEYSVRQGVFSNPNLEFPDTGEKMGSVTSAYCAMVIDEFRLPVSQFRMHVQMNVEYENSKALFGAASTMAPTIAPTLTPTMYSTADVDFNIF